MTPLNQRLRIWLRPIPSRRHSSGSVNRAGVPKIRLHDIRHTHGTLLIKAGVLVKVVSERLRHANPAFAIDTYQHVLPDMQAEAARVFEDLIRSAWLRTGGHKRHWHGISSRSSASRHAAGILDCREECFGKS